MLPDHLHKTLNFIIEYRQKRGCAPTYAEIAAGIGLHSKGAVHGYVQRLAAEGLLRVHKQHRGIEILPGVAANLPILGRIAAGRPIEAISDQAALDLNALFVGPNRFVLQVQGESMIDMGILDGDWVVCEACNHARNGEVVAVLVDQQEVTLKRILFNPKGTITLMPANVHMQAMTLEAERIQVQGKFIGLVRLQGAL